jgi:phenylacetate-CoA ligase
MTTGVATWCTINDLAARQEELFESTMDYAARSPFYQRRLAGRRPRNRAELGHLPLTTKQDLRDQYPYGMLAVDRSEVATYHESSGTGGVPTPSFYTEADWDDLTDRFARKWVHIGASDVFLVRTPYALMITGHLAHTAARRCGAMVVPGDNRSVVMPYARVVRVLHDLEVTLSWSLPTETLIWAQAARAAGHEPGRDFPALRALYVAGEPMSPARHRRIGEIWGVPVLEEYGSTETGPLAGQCPDGQLHLWADRAVFEVREPRTGRISPTGVGELVVTMLGRQAMPLLRYNLEDQVEISAEPCGCGWRLPTVRVLGRSAFGHRVGGAVVTQAGLENLVFSLPAGYGVMFWRARTDGDRLEVQLEVADAVRAAAGADLVAAIRSTYGIRAQVEGLPPGGLVPTRILTAPAEVLKPRSLFGPKEDWDNALLYY